MFTRREHMVRRCDIILIRILVAAAMVFVSALPGAAATCDRMQVTYAKGQLAIHSAGCSLQQVLEAIQEKMDIELKFPASTASTTIAVDLEAGDPAAVVSALLQPTKFNFALAGGEGSPLTFVIVTERSSAPIPVAMPAAPSKPAAALTANAKPSNPNATDKDKKSKEDKKEKKPTGDMVAEEDSGGKKRMEIDEDTLKKLPPLPPGIPPAMWGLYPDLVANGGRPPEGPPLLPPGASPEQLAGQATVAAGNTPPVDSYYEDPPMGPKGVVGLPTLPPGIDPNMAKIYPWNLMQLINSPIRYPDLKLPPMAPPIGVSAPTGQH